jgi:hypothetical protein
MANLLDLAARLEAKANSIKTVASDRAIFVAKELLKTLVYQTPVDTSTARSNWQISLEAPLFNYIEAYEYGNFGSTARVSSQAAIFVGNEKLKEKKPGQSIFITNNAPYIRDLNSGTSRQAPAGFVEASVMIVRKKLKNG